MRKLIKELYTVAGQYSDRLTKMLIFESLKSVFDGINLGAVLLFLVTVCERVFDKRAVILSDIYKITAIALIGIIGKITFGYLSDKNKYIASYSMGGDNRLYIGDRLKKVNMGYFSSNRLGDISGGLTTVIGELETTGVLIIEMLIVGIIQTAVMALFIIPFDLFTGMIIIIALGAGLCVNALFQAKADSQTERLQALKINLSSSVIEFVKGIGVIKSFGHGNKILDELNKTISENKQGFFNVEKVIAPVSILFLMIFRITSCIIIASSLYRYISGSLEVYKAIMLIVASFMVFTGFEMTGSMQNIRGVAVQDLDAVTKLRNIKIMEEGSRTEINRAAIEFENVDFAYNEGSEKLFHKLNLKIEDKTTVAVVGPSGSGKTTLCNLMARFWDVDKGSVMIDGVNIKEYSYDDLLSKFTFVFQDVYLFDDTIKNNIKFGKPDAEDEEIMEVAKKACCHDFIMELPEGYDTVLQEGGSNLSGGERQRISIARAMLKPSRFVILDEATSSVDPENEEQLMTAINNLLKDKTAVIIAHKLGTIRNADNIIVLNNGSIESSGRHEELMKKSKIYKRFILQREKAAEWKLE